MSVGNIIIGAILISIGIWFIIKAFWFNHSVFFLGWAEKKWGTGSGTSAYRFIGLGLIVLGMFCIIGIVDIYGTAFGGGKQSNPQINKSTSPRILNPRNGIIAP
jgi:hypothetical protein